MKCSLGVSNFVEEISSLSLVSSKREGKKISIHIPNAKEKKNVRLNKVVSIPQFQQLFV